MRLRETTRQIVAGGASSVAFVTLFSASHFALWISGLLTAAVYGATILVIERKKESIEIEVDAGLSQADVDQAVTFCRESARTLHQLSGEVMRDQELSKIFLELARFTNLIADNYEKDPQDLRHSRGFVDHHLPKLVKASRTYVELSKVIGTAETRQRLSEIRPQFAEYVPRVEAIYNACLLNDFDGLALETASLQTIMKSEEAPTRQSTVRRRNNA